ncbi:MAG: nucleotide-diphospho-sugar transferase [Bacteroidota bacterium]|jgi:hypothetical protein
MKSELFNTPILFLIFNRPETTEKVFQRIRDIQPRRLFVSADGPRQHKTGEDRLCAETRKIVEKVDWKCELQTNFSKKNLGCRIGVSSGIDWFFRHVAEGIILEDDCVPDSSFFRFCDTLLEYYRNDERIMHIGGANFQDGSTRGDGSYYFSNINHVWGWATWKRAWDLYDVEMKSYPQYLHEEKLLQLFPDPTIRTYWKRNFDLVYEHKKDTWDFQWQYATSFYRGLALIPNRNLISNIGFDQNATHTIDNFYTLANRPTASIAQIIHPEIIVPDLYADRYTFKKYMNPNKFNKTRQMIRRWLNKIYFL